MTRYAFTFDSSACSGCKACQAACKDKHGLPVGVLWRRVYEVSGGGWTQRDAAWVSDVFAYNISMACNHCERPICAEVCPADAYTIRSDGLVLLDTTKCLGCKYCSWACPYGAPQYDENAGHMTKCTFCVDNLDAGQPPACVAACPLRVLDVGERATANLPHPVYPLPEPHFTEPSLIIKPHAAAIRATAASARVGNWEETSPRYTESISEERSLIIFTLLAQLAVGTFWMLNAAVLGQSDQINLRPGWLIVGVMMVAGILASLFHLGRPRRAWRAFGNLRHSWLSREIAFATSFAFGSAVFALAQLLPSGALTGVGVLNGLTSLAGLGLIVAMGRAYQLRTVLVWHTPLIPASFFVTTLLLGALSATTMVGLFASTEFDLTLARLAVTLLVIAQGGIWAAWLAGMKGTNAALESANRLHPRRAWLWLRVVLASVGMAIVVSTTAALSWLLAFGFIFASELIGRVIFYAARVRQGV